MKVGLDKTKDDSRLGDGGEKCFSGENGQVYSAKKEKKPTPCNSGEDEPTLRLARWASAAA
jgi:hypothetical protein